DRYTTYLAPVISHPGRGGLHLLLDMSLSPCCRFHPAEVEMPHRSDFGTPCCLRPSEAGSALGSRLFEATYAFTGQGLPRGGYESPGRNDRWASGFWRFWTPPPSCHPNYRAPDFCPGRSISC